MVSFLVPVLVAVFLITTIIVYCRANAQPQTGNRESFWKVIESRAAAIRSAFCPCFFSRHDLLPDELHDVGHDRIA
jgi:hypothetical protein